MDISEWNVPPLYRSIVTFSLILSVQVMFCVVPAVQISAPFGDETVIADVCRVKFALDTSVIEPLLTLVITTV